MDRFHIVAANYNRLDSFVHNFPKIKNFNNSLDKVYILDCSSNNRITNQLLIANRLARYGLHWNKNLFFIRRRNWNLNHGAHLDYMRLVLQEKISIAAYMILIQEHYFDLDNYVKEDTIPSQATFDLDIIENKFNKYNMIGCIFYSRNGIRVCLSNPIKTERDYFYGDIETIKRRYSYTGYYSKYYKEVKQNKKIEGAKIRCFCVDGGNYIVRSRLYLDWFKKRKKMMIDGDGSFGFCHVWETRLGKILYDQKIKWVDMFNKVEYSSYNELMELEKKNHKRYSRYWYDNRVWYFFYGRDQIRYLPFPFFAMNKYFFGNFLQNIFNYDKNLRLRFLSYKNEIKKVGGYER